MMEDGCREGRMGAGRARRRATDAAGAFDASVRESSVDNGLVGPDLGCGDSSGRILLRSAASGLSQSCSRIGAWILVSRFAAQTAFVALANVHRRRLGPIGA